MINFLEKIIASSSLTVHNEKTDERLTMLEKAVSDLVFVVSEQQKIIANIAINQDQLITQIINASISPGDLN